MINKDKKSEKRASHSGVIFIKSAVWTLVAILLVAIGYFGAEYLSGVR